MDSILLIDDDVELCELLLDFLKPEGFCADAVHDGADGVRLLLGGSYELVVLDVMLPGISGFEVLRRIREQSCVPVLMLTARGEDVDRIVGLEMGADDYLPKPFNPRELVARMRAVLRRARPGSEGIGARSSPQPIVVGDVRLDPGTRIVYRRGEIVDLTTVEFNLLEILMRSAGRVVTRESLVENVLSRSLSPYDRSIDVHMSSIRKKLGHKMGEMERIRTVRGVGYIYTLPPLPTGEDADERA